MHRSAEAVFDVFRILKRMMRNSYRTASGLQRIVSANIDSHLTASRATFILITFERLFRIFVRFVLSAWSAASYYWLRRAPPIYLTIYDTLIYLASKPDDILPTNFDTFVLAI